jgi:hypothetical protein
LTHTIETATACYTGGGIYIYYGQLENGLFFRTWDECETVYICNSDTSTEEAEHADFYELHTVEEITGEAFKAFFNQIISHVLNEGPVFDEWCNYSKSDLEHRIIK